MNELPLSIIVILYNMRREARRTLYSLSSRYQVDVSTDEYEVVVIDNGSSAPLSASEVKGFGSNFRYMYFDTDAVTPVDAVNAGARISNGQYIGVLIDGARMATPGLISNSIRGLQLFPEPFIYALSWHLGPDIQSASMCNGYNQAEEDRILQELNWEDNGYRLFEVSTIAPSSHYGYLGGVPHECSWIATRLSSFLSLGGYDPRFRSPGGGFANHDFRNRVMGLSGVTPVQILGEGVFHQFHGGVCTNVKIEDIPLNEFAKEFEEIYGRPLQKALAPDPYLIGAITPEARRFMSG